MMVSFVLSFFPRDVLDEILNLIESVSEDFPSYSFMKTILTPILNFEIRTFYRDIELYRIDVLNTLRAVPCKHQNIYIVVRHA